MAAHLRFRSIANVRVFGRPMSFWQDQMPKGMFLRSGWRASYIADPKQSFTLEAFQSAADAPVPTPVPLDRFVQYGLWFQRKTFPEVDQRFVAKIVDNHGEFQVVLDDGETLAFKRVIVATGIEPFAYVPAKFASLPRTLASHASQHTNLQVFKGQKVAIIGGGQSALESAALLREAGAEVDVYLRDSDVHFLGWRGRITAFKPFFRLLYSWTDVGPAGLSQLVSHPDYFRVLPTGIQDPIAHRCIRPAGASWLPKRLTGVRIHRASGIQRATPVGTQLELAFNDGSISTVDHLLMGTGYQVDISKYRFLAPELLTSIRQISGYPVLDRNFESSVAGLHFLGAPAAQTFGPLMRFVAGAKFACGRLLSSLVEV